MRLAKCLTDSLYDDGTISDDEKEIVQFGFESIGGNLLGIIVTLIVGICFKQVLDALFLWLLLFPLRKNAGGFHAETKSRCFLVSVIMLIITFSLYTVPDHTVLFYSLSSIIAGSFIWVLAPVGNLTKELDRVEHKVYRIRSRIILGIEGMILILAIYFHWDAVIRSISMTFTIVNFSLLMGLLKLMVRNRFIQ